jgi:hypothetical protein
MNDGCAFMKSCNPTLLLALLVMACQPKKQVATETQRPDSAAVTDTTAAADAAAMESPDNFIIFPGRQVGMVKGTSTEASLRDLLGPENVVRDTVYMSEGEFEMGTTLFKNTADQAQIIWKDKARFANPEVVFLRPAYDDTNQLRPGTAGQQVQWTMPVGEAGRIGIGTSLRAVQQANGKPFKLYGFGWDYGGASAGWQKGNLETPDGKSYLTLHFGFEADFYETENKLYESVLGDSEFGSDSPAMQRLNPTVKTITLSF